MPKGFIPCKLYVYDLTLTLEAQVEICLTEVIPRFQARHVKQMWDGNYFCREGLATGPRPAIRG
jgi:hypothetical protein